MKQEKSRQNKPPAGPGTSSMFCRANARCKWHGCACTKLIVFTFLISQQHSALVSIVEFEHWHNTY
jgi:hypothetical protein